MLFVGGSQPVAVNLFPAPWDKLAHLVTYGIILIFSKLAFPQIKLQILLILTIFIGALDEFHQLYLPGRSAGLDDLLADTIGGLCAFLIIRYFTNKISLFRK